MDLNNLLKIWGGASNFQKAGCALVTGGTIYILLKIFRREKKLDFPRDTVIIYQFGRGPLVPSLSPFAIKLETFCRLANIPYQNVHDVHKPSKKKQFPYIKYNEEEIADSEFSLQFIIKTFGVNVNRHLTPEQEGAGRAIQRMLEENTYWTMVSDRWLFDESNEIYRYMSLKLPSIFIPLVKRSARKITYSHGIGRHSKEEIYEIMRTDLEAVSKYLGNKRFLMGDEPCQYDCAAFGMLAEIRWAVFGGHAGNIIKEFQNVCDYCDRKKDRFWPDWERSIQPSGTTQDVYMVNPGTK